MIIKEYAFEYVPITLTINTKKIPHTFENQVIFEEIFFIGARSNRGGRHYSETINNLEDAVKIFKEYIDLIFYFGGGEVTLYVITNDGYEVIYNEIV